MGRSEKEHLHRILTTHLDTIHETFQVFDQPAASSLDKVSWEEVLKMGDQVSKQATIVGMLWTGEEPKAKAIEETMTAYFNVLQGFLLLSHGSTVGAGLTLSASIYASVKQVVDSSFRLMKECLYLYGTHAKERKLVIPQLVGALWEACSALKKTPSTNITAIGRAMTLVAVSMKDVLREMKDLKPASSNAIDKISEEACAEEECKTNGDESSEGDIGNDLSPEEMKVAQLAIAVVSETLSVVKELIRSITGLLKRENPGHTKNFVDSLEKLLKLCQVIGLQIDEIGACLYPPQEVSAMKLALEKICSSADELRAELGTIGETSDVFLQACNSLRNTIQHLESELSSVANLEAKVQSVALSN